MECSNAGERRKSETIPIRVMIVEDDVDFIFLIQKLLSQHKNIQIVGNCREKREAVEIALKCQPDLVLMDLDLGTSSSDGIEISREIRILTDAKVLILTALESPDIILKAAKEAFASGYVFKSQPNLLIENIYALAEGYTAQEYLLASQALSCLSEAEMAVFHIMMGKNIKLQSAPKTIANQKTRILKKLGLENQKDLLHVFRLYNVAT